MDGRIDECLVGWLVYPLHIYDTTHMYVCQVKPVVGYVLQTLKKYIHNICV